MDTNGQLSDDEWQVVWNAYRASCLSIAGFYREQIHLCCPSGRKPSLWALYRHLRDMRQAAVPDQVSIVSLDSAELAGQAAADSGKNRTAQNRNPQGTVRLVLPRGVRVEIETPSPEAFMAAVIERIGGAR